MCENILDFLQNIQDSNAIPNKSPLFEKPFLILEQLGYIHQGYTNTNKVSNYNIFEKVVGAITQQLSIYYDFGKDIGYVDSTCFLKHDMNVKHIVYYDQNRRLQTKEIIPDGAYNYCELNFYYTYKNETLNKTRFRNRPYPKSLPEVYINEIILDNETISYIDFIYFGYPSQNNLLIDINLVDVRGIEFCETTFKSIIEINLDNKTIEELMNHFPIKITPEQECVIKMSKI